MILCGWCHAETTPGRCSTCGRDPALPWVQRAEEPPIVDEAYRVRRALTEATTAIAAEGLAPTIALLAERLDVTDRTVRRWREMSAPRPSDVRPARTKVEP